jgi:hypothetical protein
MSGGEKKYTERDLVMAQREAFARGGYLLRDPFTPRDEWRRRAEREYPLPRVTRARVVRDTAGIAWRVVDGRLEFDRGDERLEPSQQWATTDWYGTLRIGAERIRLWADLLANPTEEVEDTV